ncbi:conserved exported hypothetical protein [Rubrivivax sp. A210]|uniref:Lcl C-terminal domain-containing protein n=1 Tax=Rubrivivax sp. A210 TaxID=2772301 RepID=UPI00191ACBF4|nr:DUF1566 domain-containing protein [Rubrivivax sp. A210]CAD5371011.1 conserved exported hypothetical protein [Rubrivivax sp. A210]
MSTITSRNVLLVAACCLPAIGHAALEDRGGGLIYDNVRKITWLQDANYAKTSGYPTQFIDGSMTWSAANTWANNLVFHDSVRNVDYSDWRLPTVVGSGLVDGFAPKDPLFINIENFYYWSGSGDHPSNPSSVWATNYGDGTVTTIYPGNNVYAWAVRSGDVAAVPEPQTYAMMLLGISALLVAVRRRPS